MLLTLIQKEMMHHILSVRFIVLLLMCLLLVPLTLSMNYQHYRQNLVDYQETVKLANTEETEVNTNMGLDPELEVSKLFLKPTPLSVFANGLGDVLPSYLGMTRNGIIQGPSALVSTSLSYLLGHLDFLFLVGTVFSLLALLFTFDAVAGEREAGTLRVTLANSLPRDIFLWSKLIGGYIVFVVPFSVSFLFGLLLLVAQGFPLGEPEIFPRVLSLMLASSIYIAVFFAIGTVISTYLDNSKTALIVAFTVWVFAVLITPRVGFLSAKFIAPTQTLQSVYLEKTAVREDVNGKIEENQNKISAEVWKGKSGLSFEEQFALGDEIDRQMKPIHKEFRQKFNDSMGEIDRRYKREKTRQEGVAETLSRISPVSSFIYLSTNLTQTGKTKRNSYLQAGEQYYDVLDEDWFSKVVDHVNSRWHDPKKNIKIAQPPTLKNSTLGETFRQSLMDILLLVFFAVVLTTVAFLKFFSVDI